MFPLCLLCLLPTAVALTSVLTSITPTWKWCLENNSFNNYLYTTSILAKSCFHVLTEAKSTTTLCVCVCVNNNVELIIDVHKRSITLCYFSHDIVVWVISTGPFHYLMSPSQFRSSFSSLSIILHSYSFSLCECIVFQILWYLNAAE